MSPAGTRNIAFGEVNTYVILVHNKHTPTNEEWNEYIQFNIRTFTPGDMMKYLIITDGGAPTTKQRMILNEKLSEYVRGRQHLFRSAIVTGSTLVRGVVTAISWFNSGICAFSPQHLEDAMNYLEIPDQYHADIRVLIKKLRTTLPAPPPIKGAEGK